jgi:hypothetical protein
VDGNARANVGDFFVSRCRVQLSAAAKSAATG